MIKDKRAGSTSLMKEIGSSEVPSDHHEAAVECDPLSKLTDSGIIGCGMDNQCVENEDSELGGFCVALKQAPSINRSSQQDGPVCIEADYGLTCDCSQFDNTSGVGTIACTTEEYCDVSGELCATIGYSYTINPDTSYEVEVCYDFNEKVGTTLGVESYCLSVSVMSDLTSAECEIKVNDVACNKCGFQQATCPDTIAYSSYMGNVFDCTNTVINV